MITLFSGMSMHYLVNGLKAYIALHDIHLCTCTFIYSTLLISFVCSSVAHVPCVAFVTCSCTLNKKNTEM